ncbi:MAG TPA: hypothetical protein K8V29_02520 [Staphylococcus auricularis]|nr:hypothetical protein [Staphylococcus auricularis]
MQRRSNKKEKDTISENRQQPHEARQHNVTSHSPESTHSDTEATQQRSNIYRIIPIGIALFIIILLLLIFFLLRNFNSPEAQSKLLINAIDNNDTQKLSSVLSTKNNTVGKDEAAAYINYIKKEIGMKSFQQDVYDEIEQLNNHSSSVNGYIKGKNGDNILKITKNGTRYLFFDNMNFTAPTKEAIIKPGMTATYEYKADDQKKQVKAEKNHTTSLGRFIPGNYELNATKETANGTFTGHINFDFAESNKETVDVKEHFNEAYVTVKLEGDRHVDRDSVKVKINGKTYDYQKGKAYGPYPDTQNINVSATGQAKKKTFDTNETTLKTDNIKEDTEAMLHFDDKEIDDYVAKKEKEENSLKNKVTQFFSKYTSAINLAQSNDDFNLVADFLKEDSSQYKDVKQDIEQDGFTWMQPPVVTEIIRQGHRYDITAEGFKANGEYGELNYQLEDDGTSANDLVLVHAEEQ